MAKGSESTKVRMKVFKVVSGYGTFDAWDDAQKETAISGVTSWEEVDVDTYHKIHDWALLMNHKIKKGRDETYVVLVDEGPLDIASTIAEYEQLIDEQKAREEKRKAAEKKAQKTKEQKKKERELKKLEELKAKYEKEQ